MAYALLIISVFIFASSLVGIRAALTDYSPLELAVFRFIIASLTLAIVALKAGIRLPARKDLRLALFIGFSSVDWNPDLVSFDLSEAAAWLEFTDPDDLRVRHLLAGPRGEGLYLLGLQTIPEPTSFLLAAMGLLGLLAWRRRRARRAA